MVLLQRLGPIWQCGTIHGTACVLPNLHDTCNIYCGDASRVAGCQSRKHGECLQSLPLLSPNGTTFKEPGATASLGAQNNIRAKFRLATKDVNAMGDALYAFGEKYTTPSTFNRQESWRMLLVTAFLPKAYRLPGLVFRGGGTVS